MSSAAERVPPNLAPDLAHYSDNPLVTVQVMAHDGDAHLLPRALRSVYEQDLDPALMEIQLVFDGRPSAESERIIADATASAPCSVNEYVSEPKTGYYCVPRNRALPAAWGFYIAHMDADNMFLPGHLRGLLNAIRAARGEEGWPHFVYSRREYVDERGTADRARHKLVTGPSPLVEWNDDNIEMLLSSPQGNFIDTGDLLIGVGTLYELAERTGYVWNSNARRFGDWDLVGRLAKAGFRGRAVDQVTHRYHWTGTNLQLTRRLSDIVALPEAILDRLRAEGKVRI